MVFQCQVDSVETTISAMMEDLLSVSVLICSYFCILWWISVKAEMFLKLTNSTSWLS